MKSWQFYWLIGAGIYNIVWGAIVIIFPDLFFSLADLPIPTYPEIWQCVGMIVGVYGLGYIIAASDPGRHWPIIFVGFLGKIFGPLGFIQSILIGNFNLKFGMTIIFNDMIWWIPFFIILKEKYDSFYREETTKLSLKEVLDFLPNSDEKPNLIIFLRHSGCTFCKSTLAGIQKNRQVLESKYNIILVHQSDPVKFEEIKLRYNLSGLDSISDTQRNLYLYFGFLKGSLSQLFGLKVWWHGLIETLKGHIIGPLDGDGFQMPGVIVIKGHSVFYKYEYKSSADQIPLTELKELEI